LLIRVTVLFTLLVACQQAEPHADSQQWTRQQLPELLNELERAYYTVSDLHIEYWGGIGTGEIQLKSSREPFGPETLAYIEGVSAPLRQILGPAVQVDSIERDSIELLLLGGNDGFMDSGMGLFQHLYPQVSLTRRPDRGDYLLEFPESPGEIERIQAIIDLHFNDADQLRRVTVKAAGFGLVPSLAPPSE